MVDEDMGSWSYGYDALGNLIRQSDARGCTAYLVYDGLNRLTDKFYYSADDECRRTPEATYTYDGGTNGIGQRTSMTDGSGTTNWTYDIRGRMTSEVRDVSGVGTFTTRWTYNSADLVTSMQYPSDASGNVSEVVNYSYKPQKTLDQVSGNAGIQPYVAQTHYDGAGRMVSQALGNAINITHSYYDWKIVDQGNSPGDTQGRLKRIQSGALQDLTYHYDQGGNILNINSQAGTAQTQTFTYDNLDRLLTAAADGTDLQGGYSQGYSYDQTTGNLSMKAGVSYTYPTPTTVPTAGPAPIRTP